MNDPVALITGTGLKMRLERNPAEIKRVDFLLLEKILLFPVIIIHGIENLSVAL